MNDAPRAHTGAYLYHDDDCRCVEGDMFCNRDGRCWTCCGACKEQSMCTAPEMHPTNPLHPLFGRTYDSYDERRRPRWRSDEEIAVLWAAYRGKLS